MSSTQWTLWWQKWYWYSKHSGPSLEWYISNKKFLKSCSTYLNYWWQILDNPNDLNNSDDFYVTPIVDILPTKFKTTTKWKGKTCFCVASVIVIVKRSWAWGPGIMKGIAEYEGLIPVSRFPPCLLCLSSTIKSLPKQEVKATSWHNRNIFFLHSILSFPYHFLKPANTSISMNTNSDTTSPSFTCTFLFLSLIEHVSELISEK